MTNILSLGLVVSVIFFNSNFAAAQNKVRAVSRGGPARAVQGNSGPSRSQTRVSPLAPRQSGMSPRQTAAPRQSTRPTTSSPTFRQQQQSIPSSGGNNFSGPRKNSEPKFNTEHGNRFSPQPSQTLQIPQATNQGSSTRARKQDLKPNRISDSVRSINGASPKVDRVERMEPQRNTSRAINLTANSKNEIQQNRPQVQKNNLRATQIKPSASDTPYQTQTVKRGSKELSYNYYKTKNGQFVQRTHVHHGRTVVRNYAGYQRGHHHYFVYVPHYHHPIWFYGWACTPWPHPVVWHWGWYGDPWFVYYGYYYPLYPVYVGPSQWLTDYVMAQIILERYETAIANQQAQAQANLDRAIAINEQTKALLQAQIEANIRAQENEELITLTDTLKDENHIYVVSEDVNVTSLESNSTCALSGGDLVKLAAPAGEKDEIVTMQVLASKAESCAAGTKVLMSIDWLQKFENNFSEKLEDGMEQMKTDLASELPAGN